MLRRAPIVLALIAACRGGAPASPTDQPLDFLVWSAADDHPVTRWLDAAGHERGRTAGILIAAGGTVWRLARSTHTVTTAGCRDDDGGRRVPGSATLTDLAVTSADGRTRLIVVRREPAEVAELETYDHSVAVQASLGPLVFGEEVVDEYACGAHGGVEATAFTFDVEARAHRAIEPRLAPAVLGPRIRAAFERAAIEGLEVAAPPKLAETLPLWTDGALAARHLAFVDTCYACSNGAWSSYTSGLWIEDVRIPDEWAMAAEVTPAIAAAIGNPGAIPTGVSWGVPDAGWRRLFAPAPPPP